MTGAATAIGAGIAAVGAVASSSIQAHAARDAANTQATAAKNATDAQMSMFDQQQANMQPQITLGQNASTALEHLNGFIGGKPDYSGFDNSPGYKFALQQGQSAINRQAAASGGLYSSNTLAALNNYAQGTASQQYQNYVSNLMQQAGMGSSGAAQLGAQGTQVGQNVGNNIMTAGAANAAGQLGQGNAFSNAIGSVANNRGFQNGVNNYFTNSQLQPIQAGGTYMMTQNGGAGGGIGNIVDSVD
jgi:hypothetical protein